MRKEMANVTHTVLQQCLRPDKDVLLPNMDSGSVHDLLFIVAYTQQHGAEIISERIRRQFRHCEQLQSADLMFCCFSQLSDADVERNNRIDGNFRGTHG